MKSMRDILGMTYKEILCPQVLDRMIHQPVKSFYYRLDTKEYRFLDTPVELSETMGSILYLYKGDHWVVVYGLNNLIIPVDLVKGSYHYFYTNIIYSIDKQYRDSESGQAVYEDTLREEYNNLSVEEKAQRTFHQWLNDCLDEDGFLEET